jgi:hypothetical protein
MSTVAIPYIIILNYTKPHTIIYDAVNKDNLFSTLIDKIVNIMHELYDNELTSFDDFINRQTKLPNILHEINNSQYISCNAELKNYKDFIIKYFNNKTDKQVIEIVYFDDNQWIKYNIPHNLVYNIYKINYL